MKKILMTLTYGRACSRSTKRTSSFCARLIAALAAVLSCATTLMAEPISPQTARQAATKFLQAKGVSLKGEAMRAASRAMGRSTNGGEQTEASPYYVFNATASKGFVVVSGDDCVGDNLVLGYTSQGSFDAEAIPDNLQWWLDETARQICGLSRLGIKTRAMQLHDDIAPLLTSCWNQGDNTYNPQNPYNAFCPKTDEKLCQTGCMATALSQVMYYYRWPRGPIAGELPAYTMANGRVIEELPVTSFDWDNMVDDYTASTTEEQQAAVATLMRYCGQLVQMDYTPQVSNGVIYDLDLLTGVFGYAPGVYAAQSKEYSASGWDELLYSELREGRPLVYAGRSSGGGHAFVIDGYEVQEGEGYFSVNWGWGGVANGFYKINLLEPDTSGAGGSTTQDGYNIGQWVLVGLQPQKDTSAESYFYLNSIDWNGGEDAEEPSFAIINPSYRPGTFTIGLAERNDDGTPDLNRISITIEQEFPGFSYASFESGENRGIVTLPLSDDLFAGLTAGSHKLVFVNRESGTSAPWRSVFGPNCYIEVDIDDAGDVAGLVLHPRPELSATASDIKIDGLKQWGIKNTVTVTIQNTGADDYVGTVRCGIYNVEGNELKWLASLSGAGIMADAGETAELHYYVSVPQAGKYVLVLSRFGEDKDLTGTKLDDVKKAPGYVAHKSITVDELAFYLQEVGYTERTDDDGNPVHCLDLVVINQTPADYEAVVVCRLFKANAEGDYDPVELAGTTEFYVPLSLASNYWQSFPIVLPEALEPGEYSFQLLIANDFHSHLPRDYFVFAGGPITVPEPTGIRSVSTDNGPLIMDNCWYDLNGRRLASKPAAKGVYLYKGKKIIIK
jgi:hypothetical protein